MSKREVAKELSLLATLIGLIPALTGIIAAFCYIHQFVYPRTEAQVLQARVDRIESHQTLQDAQRAQDLQKIMDKLMEITRALPRASSREYSHATPDPLDQLGATPAQGSASQTD